jgi:hypothetical protein
MKVLGITNYELRTCFGFSTPCKSILSVGCVILCNMSVATWSDACDDSRVDQ